MVAANEALVCRLSPSEREGRKEKRRAKGRVAAMSSGGVELNLELDSGAENFLRVRGG